MVSIVMGFENRLEGGVEVDMNRVPLLQFRSRIDNSRHHLRQSDHCDPKPKMHFIVP